MALVSAPRVAVIDQLCNVTASFFQVTLIIRYPVGRQTSGEAKADLDQVCCMTDIFGKSQNHFTVVWLNRTVFLFNHAEALSNWRLEAQKLADALPDLEETELWRRLRGVVEALQELIQIN